MEFGFAFSSEEHAPTSLPTLDHFKAAAKLVKKEDIKGSIVLGPDPQQPIHQIGPDQEGFFRFYQ